jgi:hypothetical protein
MTGPTAEVVDAYTKELLAGRLLPLGSDTATGVCQLIDFRLLDRDGSPTGALQITKQAFVETIFRINRPDVAVFVEAQLWQGKNHVLTTRPAQPVVARQAQTMTARFALPADFLNETPYEARSRLLVRPLGSHDGEPVLTLTAQLDFTAFNPHPEQSVWSDWAWGRGGLLSPRLPWSLELVGQ